MIKHRCDCGVIRDGPCPTCERCGCKGAGEWCPVCRHVKIPAAMLGNPLIPQQSPPPAAVVSTAAAQTTCRCKAGEWCLLCSPGGAPAPKAAEPLPQGHRELRTAYLALVAAHNQVGVQLEVMGEALDQLTDTKEG